MTTRKDNIMCLYKGVSNRSHVMPPSKQKSSTLQRETGKEDKCIKKELLTLVQYKIFKSCSSGAQEFKCDEILSCQHLQSLNWYTFMCSITLQLLNIQDSSTKSRKRF